MRHPLQLTFASSRFFIAALVAALMATPEANAIINVSGDVPQAKTGFGNVIGTLPEDGNVVRDNLANPDDPLVTENAFTLAWDHENIWQDYETPQNILVGQTSSGLLQINNPSSLRYQHLVLGGVAETPLLMNGASFAGASLDLSLDGAADFDFQMQLDRTDLPTTGIGVVSVTGFGSTFNNAPTVVPGEYVAALSVSNTPSTAMKPTPDLTFRPLDGGTRSGGGYDVHVGLIGTGILNVEAGGTVQIQDALYVGLGGTANGTVTVDGAGSSLIAYGRDEYNDDTGVSDGTNVFGSIIGGHGNGILNITNSGQVSMFNGASLGAPNSSTTLNGTGTGAGTVILEGVGSTLTAYASVAIEDPTILGLGMGTETPIALAIGELHNRSGSLPTETLGSGTLDIGLGSTVKVTFSDNYTGTSADDANMVIGYNGRVHLRGGALSVDNELINNGSFEGYGQISAGSLTNTTNGSIDAGGSTTIGTERFDLQVANAMNNDGAIRGNGTLSSGTFYNGSQGSVVIEQGERLSIRSTSEDPRNLGTNGAGYSEFDDTISPAVGDYVIHVNDGSGGATDTEFYQANMGSIRVEGGEIEFGRAEIASPLDPVISAESFINGRFTTVSASSTPFVATAMPLPGDPSSAFTGTGSLIGDNVVGTIVSNDGTLNFRSGLYNSGVIAFTGGDNTVVGKVLNDRIDYDSASNSDVTSASFDHDGNPGTPNQTITVTNGQLDLPGVILISGDHTTVTFTDNVENAGTISVGPSGSIANFLGNLTFLPGGEVQLQSDLSFSSAAIIVAGEVFIESGTLTFGTLNTSSLVAGTSISLISAGSLNADSMFTSFDLPELAAGLYWDIVYDTSEDEIRAEIFSPLMAIIGADFSGDGVVDATDLAIWAANVGITSGASAIQGDADLDGDVDLDDYNLINQQIVTGVPVAASFAVSTSFSSATAIPEPTTALLALLACSAMIGTRARR